MSERGTVYVAGSRERYVAWIHTQMDRLVMALKHPDLSITQKRHWVSEIVQEEYNGDS